MTMKNPLQMKNSIISPKQRVKLKPNNWDTGNSRGISIYQYLLISDFKKEK